jgi:hypothetical protein
MADGLLQALRVSYLEQPIELDGEQAEAMSPVVAVDGPCHEIVARRSDGQHAEAALLSLAPQPVELIRLAQETEPGRLVTF